MDLAKVIDRIDRPSFPIRLLESIAEVLPGRVLSFFLYRGLSRPVCLANTFPDAKSRVWIKKYECDTYVFNPFFLAQLKGLKLGLYRFTDLDAKNFSKCTAQRIEGKLQLNPNVSVVNSEEIGYLTKGWVPSLEEAVISIPLGDKISAEIGIYGPAMQLGLTESNFAFANSYLDILNALVTKYYEICGRKILQTEREMQYDHFFIDFGKPTLTNRESEVSQFILRGYSTEAISGLLGIGQETVKTHRKHAYKKLGISSQSELLFELLKSI